MRAGRSASSSSPPSSIGSTAAARRVRSGRRSLRETSLPPAAPGMRIGLYGGSFNPAHAGHLHVSRTALRRLRLDRVWWLVTPGNPLKDRRLLASPEERVVRARTIAADPRIAVTAFEAAIGTRYTVDTLRWLVRRRPGLRFVWIMGADSLGSFHRWHRFEDILDLVPVAVIDRPGHTLSAPGARAARAFARARIPESDALSLPGRHPPAWTFLHGPRSDLSSTALRSGEAGAPMAAMP
ncbi:nicotinate-nucleotide adenylyltransferase [Methylobacterium sp. B4]|uniref:nicotinate-nucleotide adenylyltransferase n=1 Tax=Methylobacterium sp. B4 TaxID=1938755 RepID=UPI000D76D45C|nr:nicotinate-nucleotide adenylyltransferase [Methylobacterium sp. B4]